jgi:hypothetical protein
MISEISDAVISCPVHVPGLTFGSCSVHIPRREYIQGMTSKVYMAKKVKIRIKRIRILVRRVVQSIRIYGSSIGEMPVRIYIYQFCLR